MNYEEKYKSALEWMRSIYPTMQGADKEDAEHYFPELKSEDERIKRCIGMCLTDATEQRFEDFNTSLKDCLVWLEKQGEQKPAWSEEDERIRKELIERFNWELKGAEEQDAAGCSRQKDIAMFKRGIAWLEKLSGELTETDNANKQYWRGYREGKQEILDKYAIELENQKLPWNEEDEKKMNKLVSLCTGFQNSNTQLYSVSLEFQELIDWLKSLKYRVQPQPKHKPNHWKPSDEQLSSLGRFIEGVYGCVDFTNIKSIYNELKQL